MLDLYIDRNFEVSVVSRRVALAATETAMTLKKY